MIKFKKLTKKVKKAVSKKKIKKASAKRSVLTRTAEEMHEKRGANDAGENSQKDQKKHTDGGRECDESECNRAGCEKSEGASMVKKKALTVSRRRQRVRHPRHSRELPCAFYAPESPRHLRDPAPLSTRLLDRPRTAGRGADSARRCRQA